MSYLTARFPANTYRDLLHIENSNQGFDGTLRNLESGSGQGSALWLSTVAVRFVGLLTIAGSDAELGVNPVSEGNIIWHEGNLDPSNFVSGSADLNVVGNWTFQQPVVFSRGNNQVFQEFRETDNDLQMQNIVDNSTERRFVFRPGEGGTFNTAKELGYDYASEGWFVDSDFHYNVGLTLSNNAFINAENSSGVPLSCFGLTAADNIQVGNNDADLTLIPNNGIASIQAENSGSGSDSSRLQLLASNGTTVQGSMGFLDPNALDFTISNGLGGTVNIVASNLTLNGTPIGAGGNAVIGNDVWLRWRNQQNTADIDVFKIDASDNLEFGDVNISSSVTINNNLAFMGLTTGASAVDLVKVNASDQVALGGDANEILIGSSTTTGINFQVASNSEINIDAGSNAAINITAGEALISCGTGNIELTASSGEVILERSGTNNLAATTQDETATNNTSSISIKDAGGNQRDAGFNVMPTSSLAASRTITKAFSGYQIVHTGAAATHTIDDTDAVEGVTYIIINDGSAAVTISGATFRWFDGSSVQTGNRALAVGGVVTISRSQTASTYRVWGSGLS